MNDPSLNDLKVKQIGNVSDKLKSSVGEVCK